MTIFWAKSSFFSKNWSKFWYLYREFKKFWNCNYREFRKLIKRWQVCFLFVNMWCSDQKKNSTLVFPLVLPQILLIFCYQSLQSSLPGPVFFLIHFTKKTINWRRKKKSSGTPCKFCKYQFSVSSDDCRIA